MLSTVEIVSKLELMNAMTEMFSILMAAAHNVKCNMGLNAEEALLLLQMNALTSSHLFLKRPLLALI